MEPVNPPPALCNATRKTVDSARRTAATASHAATQLSEVAPFADSTGLYQRDESRHHRDPRHCQRLRRRQPPADPV
jgi:hypothetical protein